MGSTPRCTSTIDLRSAVLATRAGLLEDKVNDGGKQERKGAQLFSILLLLKFVTIRDVFHPPASLSCLIVCRLGYLGTCREKLERAHTAPLDSRPWSADRRLLGPQRPS